MSEFKFQLTAKVIHKATGAEHFTCVTEDEIPYYSKIEQYGFLAVLNELETVLIDTAKEAQIESAKHFITEASKNKIEEVQEGFACQKLTLASSNYPV
jgi:hypothetical protein